MVAGPHTADLKRVQVKTVRTQPWFIRRSGFVGALLDQIAVYVLLGRESNEKPVRFFIAKNRDLAKLAHYPAGWAEHGFMNLKAVEPYEAKWEVLS